MNDSEDDNDGEGNECSFKNTFVDSDASMASPVVGRKSKAEALSSTIQEAEEEEEQEEQDEEEEEQEEKAVGQEKQFLKTSSLASLLPRYCQK